MKSYTDIEQSKKLAEILPIESADMWYAERYAGQVLENGEYIVEDTPNYYLSLTRPSENNYSQDTIKDVPCWSLAALLDVLPDPDLFYNDGWNLYVTVNDKIININYVDSPIDACYEIILKLKKGICYDKKDRN